ncbi:MAG: hypothetical protein WAX12_02505 [Candidatus Microthrix subdominans]
MAGRRPGTYSGTDACTGTGTRFGTYFGTDPCSCTCTDPTLPGAPAKLTSSAHRSPS